MAGWRGITYQNESLYLKVLKKNVYEVDQELGGRELPISACPGWGIDLQERKKIQIPGGMPGGA